VVDGNGDSSAVVDMGAYEKEGSPALSGSLTIIKKTTPANVFWLDFAFNGDLGDFSLNGGTDEATNRKTFENVAPGDYTITEAFDKGWWDTSIDCDGAEYTTEDKTLTVTMPAESGAEVTCTFTNERRPTIKVLKYEDLDGNGQQDEGEPPLAGWEMALYEQVNGGYEHRHYYNPRITNDEGKTHMGNMPPGTHLVCEVPQEGWENTAPGAAAIEHDGLICQEVEVQYGENVLVKFGNFEPGDLTIVKKTTPANVFWLDFAFNGDLGDFSLNGGTDEATNRKTFENVAPGDYTITEAFDKGWWDTSIDCDGAEYTTEDKTLTVTMPAESGAEVTCTFTNERRPTIKVLKYEDLDGNGQQDEGEPPLAGWEMALYEQVNGGYEHRHYYNPRITNDEGKTHMGNMPPGTHLVCEVPQEGWVNTDPGAATIEHDGLICQEVEVQYGENVEVVFGNVIEDPI
jgi:hypothetical protein